MKRLYIITGAKGHLASTVIRYLRNEDCHIRGLILPKESGEDDQQITYYRGDVTRPETLKALFSNLEGNEVIVIHTAGIISIENKISSRLYQVNVEGTRNVIRQCRRHPIKRLVYVSSVHTIPEVKNFAAGKRDFLSKGDLPFRKSPKEQMTISEADFFSEKLVTGAYASTKAEATRAVMEAAKDGLDAVIVHPSGIIGPYDSGQNHVVQMIQMYLCGRLPAGVTGGYDFVDVRDAAKGCLLAAKNGKAGNCYILSNRYVTIKEFLEQTRFLTGGKKKICLPIGLAKAFVPLFEWFSKR